MSGGEMSAMPGARDEIDASIDTLAVLQDPVRRKLYRYVAAQGREVGRDEAADALAIQRSLVAFHLDKLADAGLLDISYRRLGERRGPGAGRPAKLYRRSGAEHQITVPPRAYETAALLLVETVESAGADLRLQEVARRRGREMGSDVAERGRGVPAKASHGDGDDVDWIAAVLAMRGYEPYRDDEVFRLRNCPFHAMAAAYPPLVCGMNLAFLQGLVEGAGAARCSVRMDPRPGQCCVVLDSKTNDR